MKNSKSPSRKSHVLTVCLVSLVVAISISYSANLWPFGKDEASANRDLRHRELDLMTETVKRPQRVILICIDTLRADHLSSYGYPRKTSPVLDGLAQKQGIRFERTYASSSWTLPSMVSTFTSLHPPQHLVEDRGTRLAPDIPTLAAAFSASGWLTAGFITHIYVSSLFGLDSGFNEWHELSIDWNYGEGRQLRADAVNEEVFTWLDHHKDIPFFLYIHFFDPHWEYDPPAPFREYFLDQNYKGPANGSWQFLKNFLPKDRLMPKADLQRVKDLYDAEILWTDRQIGLLFEHLMTLGLWDETLLAVMSDHGEEFQDHGSVHHIRTLYEEVLRVPLIIKPPYGRPHEWRSVVTERVRNIDIGPTLLHLAGIRSPQSFQGESLVPLMKAPGKDRDVFARTLRHDSDKIALIQSHYKFIHNYSTTARFDELYDLSTDPMEKQSLTKTEAKISAKLGEEALAQLEQMRRPLGTARGSMTVKLTADQEENLRSLGYLQ